MVWLWVVPVQDEVIYTLKIVKAETKGSEE